MELTQLYQFKEIAECKNISKAAKKLHVTQPALSIMLRKLEDELGVQLFMRNHNKLELTKAGELVLSNVNAIQKQMELMKKELAEYKKADNTISISFCNKAAMWYFVPRFNKAYPNLCLDADMFQEGEDRIAALINKEKDLLVTSYPVTYNGIECVPFLKDRHCFSVPAEHKLAAHRYDGVYIKDALPYGPIHYLEQESDSFCRLYLAYMSEHYPQIENIIYHDYFFMIQKIQESDVLSISTELAGYFRNDGAGRILVPIRDEELSIQMYLCYRRSEKGKVKPVLSWKDYADGTE